MFYFFTALRCASMVYAMARCLSCVHTAVHYTSELYGNDGDIITQSVLLWKIRDSSFLMPKTVMKSSWVWVTQDRVVKYTVSEKKRIPNNQR